MDIISRTSVSIHGYMVRRTASEHPVHSAKWSQTTGGLCAGAAKTSATLGTQVALSPIVAVRAVQNFMKSLRETPLSDSLW